MNNSITQIENSIEALTEQIENRVSGTEGKIEEVDHIVTDKGILQTEEEHNTRKI
jgi:ferritin-like metal-binding protein YciE